MTPIKQVPEELPTVRLGSRLVRLVVAVMIVLAGVAGAAYLKKTAPKTKKRPPVKWVPSVYTKALQPTQHQVVVTAMGTVKPAREVVLRSRVSGQVVAVHPEFTEGGMVKEGDVLVRLDDTDYKLALAQRKSDFVTSRYSLQLELGKQAVAQREWDLLSDRQADSQADPDLALRKPHLEKAKADLAAAEAAVEKAELDLERTRIRAPFNAAIRNKSIDVGSQVSPQESLADLVGTDTYWIEATLPVDRLHWIHIPNRSGETGSVARIHHAGGRTIQGHVIRLLSDLTDQGRMAVVLVEVRDPFSQGKDVRSGPPLLMGEYVRVDIEGKILTNVFVISRTALRDNDSIWLLTPDNRLAIREVIPVWRDAETVVIRDGLKAGDGVIVTDLSAPVPGMELRLAETTPKEKEEAQGK